MTSKSTLTAFFLLSVVSAYASEPIVKIHYLGHSSFVLQFDNKTTVLIDYGKSKSYYEHDPQKWNSPIYDIGELRPDIVTYSHLHHVDHYLEEREPQDVPLMLKAKDATLVYNDVRIESFRTSENYEGNVGDSSNLSYLFTYKGIKILHLGDVQGDVINIENPNVKNRISELFPDTYDLLLMPIEGTSRFISQWEIFLSLLKPKRVIPMHYWTTKYKKDFLRYLDESSALKFEIQEFESPRYSLFGTDTHRGTVEVISLEPAVFVSGRLPAN
jgi:L-ascorbate metabolism protein UlaG (beta-lactamase superfamily)